MIALVMGLSTAVLLPAANPPASCAAEYSIGIGAGYFLPVGDWKEHRYAGVDQFAGHVAFQGDFEIRWSRLLGFALNAGYDHLGTGEWSDYAASRGDAVDASAFIFHAGIVWRPHLWEDRCNALSLLVGFNYSAPTGQETFEEITYDYDFMKDKIGYQLGLEFEHDISESLALMVSVSGLIIPGGVEYADGVSYTITGLPMTAGVRFRF
jgi:hypothetical protein